MSNEPISTRPVSDQEKILRDEFYKAIAGQSDLMDKVSERLLTLELAIPGLYATVLKLVGGEKATVYVNAAFYATFAFWLLALAFTLAALTPKKRLVNPNLLKQDPQKMAEGLGMIDFFEQSANYKRRLAILSSVFFFLGVFCAAYTIG